MKAEGCRFILPVALSLVLIAPTIETGTVYFGQYMREPQLYIQSDGDLADIAKWLNAP